MQELSSLSWSEMGARKCAVTDLVGRRIVQVQGLEISSTEVRFFCQDGTVFGWYHNQDCCEHVHVEDIVGDIADLVDATVIEARQETNSDADPADYTERRNAEDPKWNPCRDCYTWTFYIIQTDKGAVTVRWLGESNGYYSEEVDMVRISP